ncbi:Uncharacterised protein [Stenotrophomonas maltophilia]|nr:Uncharacterised protein [Stenotrophomonas maltophilia]
MAAVANQHAAGRDLHAHADRGRAITRAFADRRADGRARTRVGRAPMAVWQPDTGPQRHPARIAFVVVAGIAASILAHAFVHRLRRLDVDVADFALADDRGFAGRRRRGITAYHPWSGIARALQVAYLLAAAVAGRVLQGNGAVAGNAAVHPHVLGPGGGRRPRQQQAQAEGGAQQAHGGSVRDCPRQCNRQLRSAARCR